MSGFIDATGATRHALPKEALRKLYRDLENFVADLTPEEYQRDKESFIKVFTAIHQRERENK